eukprot:3330597-Rhodomonas_salina.1
MEQVRPLAANSLNSLTPRTSSQNSLILMNSMETELVRLLSILLGKEFALFFFSLISLPNFGVLLHITGLT